MSYKVESKILDDEVRKNWQDGQFIQLPSGNTHYKIEGEGENWVVLVHGYATPYFIYDRIAEGLVKDGFRVLRYDLYGRGLSERVKAVYCPQFFSKQLEELVDALLPNEKFVLVGTSMGGTITTTYVANHYERVKKLILLAPAGMTFMPSLPMRISNVKGIGTALFYAIGGKKLVENCASEIIYSGSEVQQAYREEFASYAQYKGFLRCTLSSLRNTILNFKEDKKGYVGTAKSKIPVLVVWGTADKTMPYYQVNEMKETLPQMELVTYENSGHIFLYDEGERTLQTILPFIHK